MNSKSSTTAKETTIKNSPKKANKAGVTTITRETPPFETDQSKRDGKRTAHLTMQLKPTDPGYRLIYALLNEINRRGIPTATEACERFLNISHGHFSLLRSGDASPTGINTVTAAHFADFLGVSPMAVRLLADAIKPEEFYTAREDLEKEFDSALEYIMASDETWSSFMPGEILVSSLQMKVFAVRAYEAATNKKLVTEGVDYGKLLDDLMP